MLCVVFGAGKAHKKDKGIIEKDNYNYNKDQNSLLLEEITY